MIATKYIVGIVMALTLTTIISTGQHNSPVCPDDFATGEEQVVATNAWTNSYFDGHPDANLTDWANARRAFYVENHCTASLQRIEDAEAGKGDPATMEMVNKVIRDAVDGSTQ